MLLSLRCNGASGSPVLHTFCTIDHNNCITQSHELQILRLVLQSRTLFMVSSFGEMIFGGAKFSLHHRSYKIEVEKTCN